MEIFGTLLACLMKNPGSNSIYRDHIAVITCMLPLKLHMISGI